jgi:hypothetical protein
VRGIIAATSAAGLAAAIVLNAPAHVRPDVIVSALAAVVLTISAATRWPTLLAWALTAFLVAYAVALVGNPHLDLHVPLIGAGLLVVGELVSRTGLRSSSTHDRRGNHVIDVVGLGLAAVLIGDVVLAAALLGVHASLILEAIAAVAAVGVFFLLSRVAKERAGADLPPDG